MKRLDATEEQKIALLRQTIPLQEKAIKIFSDKTGHPRLIATKNGIYPRYKDPLSVHMQLLLAIRIVSALNASLYLLEKGFVQEVGVLIRIMEEFKYKILFIQEGHTEGTLTADQKRFINSFFADDITSFEDILSQKKIEWPQMKKIYASMVRQFKKTVKDVDMERLQKTLKTIYDTYSKYVHGSYSVAMEMYDMNEARFETKGIFFGYRIRTMLDALASSTIGALNSLTEIAWTLNLKELEKELITERKKLWVSKEFEHK